MSHGDGSFEYQKHMFWFSNKKTVLFNYRPLSSGLNF